jgi:hypothetical protein
MHFFSTGGSYPEEEEFIRRPYIIFFKYSFNFNFSNYENNQQDVICFFSVALRLNASHGLLILEVFFYITHNDAPQSVGLLWMSDQLVAETST